MYIKRGITKCQAYHYKIYFCSEANRTGLGNEIEASINVYELLGSEVYLYFNVEGFPMIAIESAETKARVGDNIKFRFDMEMVHVFDNETGLIITNNKEMVVNA